MFFKDQLILSKLVPPKIDQGMVIRRRILDLFGNNPDWRIGFFSAPAGFGKTVLMSQVAASIKQIIWYQLDEYDNDPYTFFKYLIAGFELYCPSLPNRTSFFFTVGNINTRELMITFINELNEYLTSQDLLFVLDDFQFISDPNITRLIHELLLYIPKLRILISSRSNPPAAFHRLIVNQSAFHLEATDLAFTKDEIESYLSLKKIQTPPETVSKLLSNTAGWAVALNLMVRSSYLKKEIRLDMISSDMYDYLIEEVLQQFPDEIQEFISSTFFLEDFTSKFCDQLLQRKDSARILNYLEKQQLFLYSLEGSPKKYRYHHFFKDNFQGCVDRAQLNDLLARAGKLAWEDGDPNRSIEYYISAGKFEEATAVIYEIGERLILDGNWQQVDRWLKLIPSAVITGEAKLAVLRAGIEYCNGSIKEAENWINRAVAKFTDKKDQLGLWRAIGLQARILYSKGNYLESKNLLESINLPESDSWKYDLPNIQGLVNFFAIGRLDLAINLLHKKLKQAERHNAQYAVKHICRALRSLYYINGNYRKALEMHRKSVQNSAPGMEFLNHMNIATIYRDWGELDQALEIAEKSVEVKEKAKYNAALPYAYHELAAIYMDRGDLKQAEKYLNHSITTAQEVEGQKFFLILSRIYLAWCLCIQGKLAESQELLNQILKDCKGQVNYVKAICQVYGGMILVKNGRYSEGLSMLQNARQILKRIKARYPLCLCDGFLAGILAGQTDNEAAVLKNAVECLRLAAEGNFIQIFLTSFNHLEPVIRAGIKYNIEASFVQRILVKLGQPGLKILMDFLEDPDPKVRLRILSPMKEIAGLKAKKYIAKLLDDEDQDVRDAAKTIIRQLEEESVDYSSGKLLKIRSLGAFAVFTTDTEKVTVGWPTKKARDLLAYLAHQEKPIDRERIIEGIWPGSDTKNYIPLFHTTLYHLRQALNKAAGEKDYILYHNGEYQLADDCFVIDRIKFKEIVSSIPKILNTDFADYLEEILKNYQGEYLEDLDYNWVMAEREFLKRLAMEARFKLAKFYLNTGEYSKAVNHLRVLVEVNPVSEEYNSMLMIGYTGLGDRIAVKRQFQFLKKALREELGLDPSSEMRKLYYQLCATQEKTIELTSVYQI